MAYIALNITVHWFNLETLLGIFFQGFVSGVFAVLIGILVLWLLGNNEIKEIWKNIRQRFWKTRVIGSDAEIV